MDILWNYIVHIVILLIIMLIFAYFHQLVNYFSISQFRLQSCIDLNVSLALCTSYSLNCKCFTNRAL